VGLVRAPATALCTPCCSDQVWDSNLPVFEIDLATLHVEGELPRCGALGAE